MNNLEFLKIDTDTKIIDDESRKKDQKKALQILSMGIFSGLLLTAAQYYLYLKIV
ncbi:MAG: hypothetical protein OEY49_19135 [Candidatus Heimdallarchaeota archaeon]|nr:hypothetical protein [Candidatus Heimdallarchaeota archaeon]